MEKVIQERIEWIDSLKGIGIILVVFSHVHLEIGHYYLNSIKMPLFFFCSGFLISYTKYNSRKEFLSSRIKSLLYPYFVWSLILISFWLVFEKDKGDLGSNFLGIFMGAGGAKYMEWGIILWFLPSLFITEVIHYVLVKVTKWTNVIIVVLFIIGILINQNCNLFLPFSFNISIVMILFYHFGYSLRSYTNFHLSKVYFFVLFPLWLFLCIKNGSVLTYVGEFGNPVYFLASAVAETGMIISVIQNFKISILELIGKHSLLIFLVHLRTFTFLKAIQLYVLKIPLEDSLFSSIMYTVVSIVILIPISKLINTHFSFLLKYELIRNN